jgi:flagellar biosynthesis GTPase FlhF
LSVKKIIKPLKILYLAFMVLLAVTMLFAKPSFSASGKDVLIYQISNLIYIFIAFILPGIFIISPIVRKKIPLFKKENLKSTVIGWIILFIIGVAVCEVINNLHSSEYAANEKKYNLELAVKKEAAKKAKEEKKEAEERAKEEAAKKKAEEKAAAKKAKEEKKEAEEKAKEEAAKKKAEEKATAEEESKEEIAKKEAEEKVAADNKAAEDKLASEIKANQKNIDKIRSATSLNNVQSLNALNVLKSVGITSIGKIENKIDMGSGSVGYTVNGTFAMILKYGKVFAVSINNRGIMLYDSSAGGVKGKASDYILNGDEITQYISQAQDMVTRALKTPSTAKFPSQIWALDKYSICKNRDIITVHSYVDSQNSFGAMLRNEWTVQMNTKEGKFTYLALGGKVLIGKYINVQ